jgi:hypothetical protein
MKRHHFSPPDFIPPEERRVRLAKMLADGAPPAAAVVMIGEIPDAQQPPPLPSLFDLLKAKFGLQIQGSAPDWARRAADMVFDSLMPNRRRRKRSEAYQIGFESGYMDGAAQLLDRKETTPPDEPSARGCSEILKECWATRPADEAAEFFCGFRDGEKLLRGVPERAEQMAQRTKIYRALAGRWQEIKPGVLHSTGELHQWLLAQKVIVPGTDSCEVRLVCAKTGLRYQKPGKPAKS